jgi:sigma-B regulation protein RsbU (phosphoserine phosphatase)
VGEPGSLLGVFEALDLTVVDVTLGEGDMVVMYTDGVTDLPGDAGRTAEDVVALVDGLAPDISAEDSADAIHDWVVERVPSNERRDDVALVVLRIGSAEGSSMPAPG